MKNEDDLSTLLSSYDYSYLWCVPTLQDKGGSEKWYEYHVSVVIWTITTIYNNGLNTMCVT